MEDYKQILKNTRLCDLYRIRWVNPTFAFMLLEAGYSSVSRLSRADPKQLYTEIKELNGRQKIFNGAIGRNDMHLLVELAGELDIDIQE